MTDKDQYNNVCKEEFHEIKDLLNSINKKLFIDNGVECIQSKINRHDKFLQIFSYILGVIFVSMVGMVVHNLW